MSISERLFWESVRGQKLGFKFRRQHPMLGYYLDFYCAEAALAIEIDGPSHEDRIERDCVRDQRIAEAGVLTVRIPTKDLWEPTSMAFVKWLKDVQAACEERSGRSAFPP
jgi:very-short-patch-repair endonuclease